jgi:hypothetical protein
MANSVKFSSLDQKRDSKGTLGIVEFSDLDFTPARIYWISDVPPGCERGLHAHKKLSQLLCVLKGSVEIEIFSGQDKVTFNLDKNSRALQLAPGLWRILRNFSSDACVLVLCDLPYDESDYIRDFVEYLEWYKSRNV